MQATRFWVLASLGVFSSALSFSCGGDEATRQTDSTCPSCGGDEPLGGESFAGGPSFNVGGGGKGAMPVAGDAGAPLGGAGAVAGNAGNGVGGSGEGGAFGGAGGAPIGGEQLEVCGRLTMLAGTGHVYTVSKAYELGVRNDCRVNWVAAKGVDLADFDNDLAAWTYRFWGCLGTLPVDTFALVFKTPPLSQGDVDLLIDHYMTAAQDDLDLSPPEATEMRAALARLAAPLVMDPSLDPSNPSCSSGAGGAAGAAGAPP